jgi:hypothetical protein
MHGDRPLHVHAAPSAVPQAHQQEGKTVLITDLFLFKLNAHEVSTFNSK